jgi:hypothetical protein
MAYKCRSCNKISKGKKQKSLSSFFKKHRCPGCGSFDFIDIGDPIGLIYDFEELIFDLIEETDCDYEEEVDTYADEEFHGVLIAPDSREDEEDEVPHRDSVFPTTFSTDSIIADEQLQEDSSYRYNSSSSSPSYESDLGSNDYGGSDD